MKHHTTSFALRVMGWSIFSGTWVFVNTHIDAVTGFWPMWFLKLNDQTLRLVKGPKPLRWLIRACLVPFWWMGEQLAVWLDCVCPNGEEETAGYFVTAKKP
jgi:hypothetical protein